MSVQVLQVTLEPNPAICGERIIISADLFEKIETGSLTVSKTVTGEESGDKEFTFTVTLGDSSITGQYGEMIFQDGVASFPLKHGESKTATSLPHGTSYTVTESGNDGYDASSTGESGEIEANTVKVAAFVNETARWFRIVPPDPDTEISGHKVSEFQTVQYDENGAQIYYLTPVPGFQIPDDGQTMTGGQGWHIINAGGSATSYYPEAVDCYIILLLESNYTGKISISKTTIDRGSAKPGKLRPLFTRYVVTYSDGYEQYATFTQVDYRFAALDYGDSAAE